MPVRRPVVVRSRIGAAGDEAAADAAISQPVQGDVQPQHRPGDQLHAILLCADLLASV